LLYLNEIRYSAKLIYLTNLLQLTKKRSCKYVIVNIYVHLGMHVFFCFYFYFIDLLFLL